MSPMVSLISSLHLSWTSWWMASNSRVVEEVSVNQVYGAIVFVEALVILHGGVVNINKVHGIVSVESSSVLL